MRLSYQDISCSSAFSLFKTSATLHGRNSANWGYLSDGPDMCIYLYPNETLRNAPDVP